MKPSIHKFKISLEILEEKYWQENGFCLECEEFSSLHVEPFFAHECPLCGKEAYYDVDFLLKKEILFGVD